MNKTRLIVVTAIFIALAVAGGMALVQIPNVEMITVTVFLSGMLLGAWRGTMVGAIAESLYSGFNPYGAAPPPVMVAQVLCMALAGASGGIVASAFKPRTPPIWSFALAGFTVTLLFDLATTAGFAVMIGQSFKAFLAALVFGTAFTVTHVATNTLIFCLLLPILTRRLSTLPIFRDQTTKVKASSKGDIAAAPSDSPALSNDLARTSRGPHQASRPR